MNRYESSHPEPNHIIRLAGPWKFSILTGNPSKDVETTIQLPAQIAEPLPPDTRSVILRRRFGCPTNLSNERVLLGFEGLFDSSKVSINGRIIPSEQLLSVRKNWNAVDLTEQLEPNNLLEIEFQSLNVGQSLLTSARIELYATADEPTSE
ncbi:hypothetical protein [Lacunimicrobium album]